LLRERSFNAQPQAPATTAWQAVWWPAPAAGRKTGFVIQGVQTRTWRPGRIQPHSNQL